MKSFSKAISDAPVQAWIPMDLFPKQPETTPVELSEILSIFGAPAANVEANKPSRADGVIRHYFDGASVVAWQPGEIGGSIAETQPLWAAPVVEPVVEEAPDPTMEAQAKAEEILANARADAEKIIAAARGRAEEITLEAHQTGWGIAEAETVTIITTAKEIVKQVSAWREEMLAQSENDVMGLVRAVAEKMFGEGVKLDTKQLQDTFNRALEDARALGDLRIYVNPEDAANLDPYWREFQISMTGHQVQVIPSEAIKPGGCFINGQLGAVDARVETQMKAIMETLTGAEDDEEQK